MNTAGIVKTASADDIVEYLHHKKPEEFKEILKDYCNYCGLYKDTLTYKYEVTYSILLDFDEELNGKYSFKITATRTKTK